MATCDQCNKQFHFCGSCGTGHDSDQFFCSGDCEQSYSEQNGISKVGQVLQDLFTKYVDANKQSELWGIIRNNSNETGNCLLVQELQIACCTAPKNK